MLPFQVETTCTRIELLVIWNTNDYQNHAVPSSDVKCLYLETILRTMKSYLGVLKTLRLVDIGD